MRLIQKHNIFLLFKKVPTRGGIGTIFAIWQSFYLTLYEVSDIIIMVFS